MLLSELLSDFIFKEGSPAADQAKQLGLVYKGFGRWADPRTDKVTHKTDGGRLTKIDPAQTKLALDDPEVEKDPGRATDKDPEAQARMKDKSPRVGAPSERETREKRFAHRQQTKDTVKDIADQIHNHDWTYDKSDDHSAWSKGEREKNKLLDTIAKSGFTYSQTKQIFRDTGIRSTKHGTSVAGETFTPKMYREVLRKRIQITKDVQRGKKGAEPVPPAPTKWDAEKYDSGFRVPDKKDQIPTQPPGHASDVAQLAFAKTGDVKLANASRRLSPERRADLERWLDDDTQEDMPDFRQTFDVKYAMSKRGKITTVSFKNVEGAKNFLSNRQKYGAKGIISVDGSPVAKSGKDTKVVDVEPKLKKSRKSDFGGNDSDSLRDRDVRVPSSLSVQRARDAVRDLE